MSSELESAEPQVCTFDLGDGTPDWVVNAAKKHVSEDPQAVEVAKKRLQERDDISYSWSSQTREFRPALVPVIYAPPRRENIARPRERRAASRRRARAPTGDDPSPEPDLEVRSYARFRRDVRRALGETA